MKKLVLKRKDINPLLTSLEQIRSIKTFAKALDLGRDLRMLREIDAEITFALNKLRPSGYETLLDELNELKRNVAANCSREHLLNERSIAEHVLLTWDKTKIWLEMNRKYANEREALLETEITVELRTETLTCDDCDMHEVSPACAEYLSIIIN